MNAEVIIAISAVLIALASLVSATQAIILAQLFSIKGELAEHIARWESKNGD